MSGEINFSFSRDAMLKRCVREYYLHYIYAYGSYDRECADKERNHVHLLKQLKSEEGFVESLMFEAFRDIFVGGALFSDLKKTVYRKFFAAKDGMLIGAYEEDHLANPILKSFYYDEVVQADFLNDLQLKIDEWTSVLLNNDLCCSLFNCGREDFYAADEAVSVYVGDIKINFYMLGTIKMNGKFYCLSFVRSREYFSTSAVLNLFYCWQKLHVSPENVEHVFLNWHDGIYLFNDNSELNISQTIKDIAERSVNITAEHRELDLIDSPFSIPHCPDKNICSTCRFREFCRG